MNLPRSESSFTNVLIQSHWHIIHKHTGK